MLNLHSKPQTPKKVYAATAVAHLAANSILVTKLTEEGVLEPLKTLLKSPKQVPSPSLVNTERCYQE